jgi:DNA-binding MarR family transcriptional regulator
MATSTPSGQSRIPTTVATDLEELSALLWETLQGLKRAGGGAPAELREAADRSSLGARHAPIVLAVAAAEPLSVSELARRLGLGLSTTSALVGDLSRAGLLERSEDDADRRRTIVRLHDDHRAAIVRWRQSSLAPLRATLERLEPAARAGFMEGWRVLHEEATGSSAEIPPELP